MTELVFIEGVSGVGKSTMVRMISEELKSYGYSIRTHVEFDYTNPIDFYCTAYFLLDEYEILCKKYSAVADVIKANAINAGEVRLVRYYNEDAPLFEEPLLSELVQSEFCYNPSRLVTLDDYTSAYEYVWQNYTLAINETYDFVIFDGSLLHHPINDMMRNYHIVGEQAISHVSTLLYSLGERKRHIFYLKTNDIGQQLKRAHITRNQNAPTNQQIEFWETRYKNDMIVLSNMKEKYQIYDISNNCWDLVREQIKNSLISDFR